MVSLWYCKLYPDYRGKVLPTLSALDKTIPPTDFFPDELNNCHMYSRNTSSVFHLYGQQLFTSSGVAQEAQSDIGSNPSVTTATVHTDYSCIMNIALVLSQAVG